MYVGDKTARVDKLADRFDFKKRTISVTACKKQKHKHSSKISEKLTAASAVEQTSGELSCCKRRLPTIYAYYATSTMYA